MSEDTSVPVLAPGLELLGALAGSAHRSQPYLVRRSDGQTIQLTSVLYAALDAIDGSRSYEEIAPVVSRAIGKHAEADDIRFLVGEKLRPLGLVTEADGSLAEVQRSNPLLALRFRYVVSDPVRTRRITAPFAILFRPKIVVAVLLAFLASSVWVLFDKGLASPAHDAFYSPGLLLTVFGLTLVSAGFHEFGHAAACRYGGATPGVMGCGLYLLWPAFYTDVTDSYRLGRGGRLRVDLGGLYFNAVFGVAIFGLWSVTRWDALLLVIPAQLLQMLRQLAPFIRADGYHIIADLVGVPDLFAHIKPTLLGILPTHWRRPETRTLKWWARVVIIGWVLLVVPLLLAFMVVAVMMLPRLVATAWDSLGLEWAELAAHASEGELLDGVLSFLSLLSIAIPVLGITYLLWRVVSRLVRRVAAATEGRPLRRGIAVLGGAALVALLAWAWWPSDQYVPIRDDERGAVQDVRLQLTKPLAAESAVALTGRSVAPGSPASTVPPAGVAAGGMEPATLLIPREAEDRPALVITAGAGDEPVVRTIDRTDDGDWPFPFPAPPPAAEGDNRAFAVNTGDGTVVYDVAFSLVWVVDEDVDHRNEAWALARCSDCGTVAVAFQTILVIGRAEVIQPVNAAVSVNYECVRCDNWAIAVQLVATLNGVPSDAVVEQIEAIWTRLEALTEVIESLEPATTYAVLKGFEAEILRALTAAGPVEASSDSVFTGSGEPETTTTSVSTPETTTTTAAADTSGSGDTTTTEPPTSGSTTSSTTVQSAPEPEGTTTGSESTTTSAPAEESSTTTSTTSVTTQSTEETTPP